MIQTGLVDIDRSVVIAIDLQPTFLSGILDAEKVLHRSKFLVESANLLGVPVLSTIQYGEKMGGLEPSLQALLASEPHDKTSFSCCGCPEFVKDLKQQGRDQAVIVGIETHICVTQTALHFMESGWGVLVCGDAVSARSAEAHSIGHRRLRHAGVTVAHTESIVYEWLADAEHPRFRDALKLVKAYAEPPAAHRLA